MTVVAIVDTESTGLASSDEPIALALIVVRVDERGMPLEVLGRYQGLREPGVPVHPAAQRINGLTREVLRGQHFDLAAVRALLARADVMVAHNAAFDARMLGRLMDVDLPWRCSWRQFPWHKMANRKLDTVCAAFGIERGPVHDAMRDAQVLLACLLRRSGKTARSRTYLGMLLRQPAFDVRSWQAQELARAERRQQRAAPESGRARSVVLAKALAAALRAPLGLVLTAFGLGALFDRDNRRR